MADLWIGGMNTTGCVARREIMKIGSSPKGAAAEAMEGVARERRRPDTMKPEIIHVIIVDVLY